MQDTSCHLKNAAQLYEKKPIWKGLQLVNYHSSSSELGMKSQIFLSHVMCIA